jgi:lysine 2,3-aminomutase
MEPVPAMRASSSKPEAACNLVGGLFWQKVPAYAEISEAQFMDHKWQAKASTTNVSKLLAILQGFASDEFCKDLEEGFKRAPMSVRVSPYLLSLMDWTRPYQDPLRIQFIPVASLLLPDHPKIDLDSLHEKQDMPVTGLTHRYTDRALFLALDTCPVYCRFCTRSYAVGLDTEEVEKFHLRVDSSRWQQAFAYIADHPEIEDIIISGGDAYQLRAEQITEIGQTLLAMPNIRRFRYATKGLAVMPQKILTDEAWCDALTRVVENGRRLHKDVAIHTHFNHPTEITAITQAAMAKLFERGVAVRNQTVLVRGVNDTPEVMGLLIKRLCHINVRPYYVYMHDLVRGVEDLRTTLQTSLDLEKNVRGMVAGFNMPHVVVDAPGGGGKRNAYSYEHYNRETGISVYSAPAVRPGRQFVYFDPIDQLPESGRARWADPGEHEKMIQEACAAASAS